MFQTTVVEKIKIYIYKFNNLFLKKNCAICEKNVEKYGRIGQGTDDNIIRRMCVVCWMTKATHTHSECVILIAFPL
jgi:hypothetical protein